MSRAGSHSFARGHDPFLIAGSGPLGPDSGDHQYKIPSKACAQRFDFVGRTDDPVQPCLLYTSSILLMNLCGRGDKDVFRVAEILGLHK